MAHQKEHPMVLRFAGMFPHQLGGYEAHRRRKGGDLGHVDKERSGFNQRLLGSETWAQEAAAEIREMAVSNYADELAALQRRKRKKDLERRMVEGPKAPWRPTRHGPMREVILTANRKYFDRPDDDDFPFEMRLKEHREQQFEARAVAWLKAKFGDDVIHARADHDESAYHIHAVILPRAIIDAKGAKQRMLQPSKHELIENYEKAQDSVGAWFADLGLVRGERRAEAIREARKKGETPPPKRWHAHPKKWREAQDLALAEREERVGTREARTDARETQVQAREAEADAVLAAAEGLEAGDLELDTSAETPVLKQAGGEQETVASAQLRARLRRSPKGAARAASAFAAAAARMLARARQIAHAELLEAHQEIKAADDAIVEVAKLLPNDLRRLVAEARSALVKRIVRLGRFAGHSDASTISSRHGDRPEADEIVGE